jgi:hypothetical protein
MNMKLALHVKPAVEAAETHMAVVAARLPMTPAVEGPRNSVIGTSAACAVLARRTAAATATRRR